MSKDLDKGKAYITGVYSRTKKQIYDDFCRKVKDSKVKGQDGQSQKELVLERLLELYIENGDALWDFLIKYNKKEVKNGKQD